MKNRVLKTIFTFIMILLALVVLFPFYLMIIMGTQYTNDLFKGLTLIPGNYLLENFRTIVDANFGRYYFNSTYISILVTALTLLVCSMAGYGFSVYRFKGGKFIFSMCIGMMMVPTQLGIIAFAIEVKAIGWNGTHLPLIIPAAASIFAMYWIYQYCEKNLPKEVIESARVDGCGELGIFAVISLPFLKTAMLSVGLLSFLWSWNSFLVPLVVISKQELYTIPLGIKTLDVLFRVDYGAQILALGISTIPMLIFFLFFSKSLIRGLSSVAVKG